jgi:hypothetical protein
LIGLLVDNFGVFQGDLVYTFIAVLVYLMAVRYFCGHFLFVVTRKSGNPVVGHLRFPLWDTSLSST